MIMARICHLSSEIADKYLLHKLLRPLLHVLKRETRSMYCFDDDEKEEKLDEILNKFSMSTNLSIGKQIFLVNNEYISIYCLL
jgi:hypothetical protein